jgi:hypothetical protein
VFEHVFIIIFPHTICDDKCKIWRYACKHDKLDKKEKNHFDILYMSHTLKIDVLRLKTMASGQIVIAPSHWTNFFCVFDANRHLK